MSDHGRLGWIFFLTILGLLLYMLAFGAVGLTPRPSEYTPIEYRAAACLGGATDTFMFQFGVGGDVRWAELYVLTRPDHQQLVAVASYAPGAEGALQFAEVQLPSGRIVRYESAAALRASPHMDVCQVARIWLERL